MTLPEIPIRAYFKMDLRKKILNPSLNLDDKQAVAKAIPLGDIAWRELLERKLRGRVPEEEWKLSRVLSEQAVRLILAPESVGAKKNGARK